MIFSMLVVMFTFIQLAEARNVKTIEMINEQCTYIKQEKLGMKKVERVDSPATIKSLDVVAYYQPVKQVKYIEAVQDSPIGKARYEVCYLSGLPAFMAIKLHRYNSPLWATEEKVNELNKDGLSFKVFDPKKTTIEEKVYYYADGMEILPTGKKRVAVGMYDFGQSLWRGFLHLIPDDRDNPLYANVPPDPGEFGKLTLRGVDSDKDGVRDDVQRWIVMAYPDSEKTRMVLFQMTKTMQQYLLDSADPIKSFLNVKKQTRDTDCLVYIQPNRYSEIAMEHQAVFLNTKMRVKEWIKADSHPSLGGASNASKQDFKLGCRFDPNKLPN